MTTSTTTLRYIFYKCFLTSISDDPRDHIDNDFAVYISNRNFNMISYLWLVAIIILHRLIPCKCFSTSISFDPHDHIDCDFVFKLTNPRMGIGVYANKMVPSGSLIQHAIGIPIPVSSIYSNELINYVEGHNSTHAIVTLGIAMMMNHLPDTWKPMTRKESYALYSRRSGIRGLSRSFGISQDTIITANYDIYPGEELLSFYGWSWFEDRKMEMFLENKGNLRYTPRASASNDNGDLISSEENTFAASTLPGCPTLLTQFDENSGRLTAAAALLAGQIIEISRALLLPVAQMSVPNALEDFLWWPSTPTHMLFRSKDGTHYADPYAVGFDEHEPYALLLLGNGALYSPNKTSDANVLYDWWNISSLHREHPQAEDEQNPSCFQDNIQECTTACSTTAFVSFAAARDIAVGETLSVYLSTYYDYVHRVERRFPLATSFKQNCMKSNS